MKRGLTALAIVGALAAAAGCTSSGSPAPPPDTSSVSQVSTPPSSPTTSPGFPDSSTQTTQGPTKGTSAPSRAERLRALATQNPGTRSDVVRVPGGYEAAVYDQRGSITFWRNDQASTTWTQIGSSRYPYVPALGAPHAQVRGALLHGMQHPTFIVTGLFTGDGSGNAVAFTDGSSGWGAIKAEPGGNIGPSGRPVGSDQIGLSYNFGFADGDLVTADCPSNRPIYQCGRHQITKRWAWTGSDFALA